jgi:hypothetical protein
MANFFRDLYYSVAAGAIIGTIIGIRRRQARERRQAQAVPPVMVPPRPRRQRARPSELRDRSRWR